jgi:predicted acyltransferase
MSSITTLPAAAPADVAPPASTPTASRSSRITSVDALRGLVMLAMIFVNDIGHVQKKSSRGGCGTIKKTATA